MMKPVLELQEQGESYIFIANYHALTTVHDAERLNAATLDVALDFLACGLDPGRVAFYRQSDLPEVTELMWLLSVVTPMGLLERCHSFKDKIAKGIAPSHGLFAYPVLMTADILAVQADTVPVGRDQKQHLEVARDIAIKFNHLYGEVFTVPEPVIRDAAAVVPGLDGQKMSKSYHNTIDIFGDLKSIQKQVMRIVTDSKGVDAPKDPDDSVLFTLYKLLASPEQAEAMAQRFRAGGLGYGHVKKELFELFESHFHAYREKREELARNLDYVESVLRQGVEKARVPTRQTLVKARPAMGLEY